MIPSDKNSGKNSRAHRSSSDRAGGPADLSRKRVSAKGAHPLRGCVEDAAIMVSTICGLEAIRWLLGFAVEIAVALTALILIVAFLYHAGSAK